MLTAAVLENQTETLSVMTETLSVLRNIQLELSQMVAIREELGQMR